MASRLNAAGVLPLPTKWDDGGITGTPSRTYEILERTPEILFLRCGIVTGNKFWYDVCDVKINPQTKEETIRPSMNIDGVDRDDIHFSYDKMRAKYLEAIGNMEAFKIRQQNKVEAEQSFLKYEGVWYQKCCDLKQLRDRTIYSLKQLVRLETDVEILTKDKKVLDNVRLIQAIETILKFGK